MGEIVAGRYEVRQPIGAGGNAQVFEAWDRNLQRRVALKRSRTDAADPAAAERLIREAKAAARVTHPNVVAVLDAGVEDERPFLVTELVEGPTLRAVLDDRGALPVEEAVAVIGEVLAGLAAVHAEGIVHRDVKPGNVLLDADDTAKLADFGIARGPGDATALTATGQIIGTAAYLSPEQVDGRPATPRSDLYAVGVVLYELLTGSRPFSAARPAELALAQRDATVPAVLEARPEIPAEVAEVIDRALAKDPADRPQSAEAMRQALTAPSPGTEGHSDVLAAPTPTAPEAPSGPPVPAERPARRGPLPAVLVLAVLAVVVGVAAAALGDGGDPPEAQPTTTTAGPGLAALVPPTTAAVVSTVPTTVPPPPTVSGREAELATRLDEVLSEAGEEQARDAERLLRDVERWLEHGEIDPAVAQDAIEVLTPLVEDDQGPGGPPPGHGPGDKPGHGHDRGRGEGD